MMDKNARAERIHAGEVTLLVPGAPPPESAGERRAREAAERLEGLTERMEARLAEMVEATDASRAVNERAAPLLERLEVIDEATAPPKGKR